MLILNLRLDSQLSFRIKRSTGTVPACLYCLLTQIQKFQNSESALLLCKKQFEVHWEASTTVWKVSVFGVFRSVFSCIQTEYRPEKLRIWAHFTQCIFIWEEFLSLLNLKRFLFKMILKLISTSESSIKKDFLLMLIITYIVASEMKSVNDK